MLEFPERPNVDSVIIASTQNQISVNPGKEIIRFVVKIFKITITS